MPGSEARGQRFSQVGRSGHLARTHARISLIRHRFDPPSTTGAGILPHRRCARWSAGAAQQRRNRSDVDQEGLTGPRTGRR